MEELFKRFAEFAAITVELAAAAIILYGAIEGLVAIVRALLLRTPKRGIRKEVWLRFGVWLLLGLEFELAADVIRTAISPTWTDLGQLAAIAVIRTFLNYFLEKDLKEYAEPERDEGVDLKKVA
jgi:uncharacterized membrane protein